MLTPEKREKINNIADKLRAFSKFKWLALLIFWVSDYLRLPAIVGFIAFWYFVLGLLLGIVRLALVFRKCPYCQQPYSLRKVCTKEVGSEAISVKKDIVMKNKYGDETGTSEQYIPGTRSYYATVYVCQHCAGVVQSETRSKVKANL